MGGGGGQVDGQGDNQQQTAESAASVSCSRCAHLTHGCCPAAYAWLEPRRLVDAFGSTRRKRQLSARDESAVSAARLVDAGATATALAAVNQTAAEAGMTRDEVCSGPAWWGWAAHCCGLFVRGRAVEHAPAPCACASSSTPRLAAALVVPFPLLTPRKRNTATQVLARAAAQRNIPAHHPQASQPHKAYVLAEIFRGGALAAASPSMLLKAADDSAVAEQLRAKKRVCAGLRTWQPASKSHARKAEGLLRPWQQDGVGQAASALAGPAPGSCICAPHLMLRFVPHPTPLPALHGC